MSGRLKIYGLEYTDNDEKVVKRFLRKSERDDARNAVPIHIAGMEIDLFEKDITKQVMTALNLLPTEDELDEWSWIADDLSHYETCHEDVIRHEIVRKAFPKLLEVVMKLSGHFMTDEEIDDLEKNWEERINGKRT